MQRDRVQWRGAAGIPGAGERLYPEREPEASVYPDTGGVPEGLVGSGPNLSVLSHPERRNPSGVSNNDAAILPIIARFGLNSLFSLCKNDTSILPIIANVCNCIFNYLNVI